ncbi:high-affinity nickel-transport protein-domain-containing protein [Gautieria morchelliformis]|nr:high-affinity nickel-transport protein-domain-containing protein [Gautieria morchelliformis]
MFARINGFQSWNPHYELTTFARSLLLLTFCLLFNGTCWVVSGILFGRRKPTRNILSLCLLAWPITQFLFMFRSGLDADHISAIDNATRNFINLNQLPVTCGLYFSLGHSTIVIAVNVAIAISSDVYNKLGGVGNIGGVVGSAVSGSFLFIIAMANAIILWRILRRRRQINHRAMDAENGGSQHMPGESEPATHEMPGLMMRILGPITTYVNKPWKMYPVGVLFGFGFDTASSIALLAVTALAKKGVGGPSIAQGDIVILPFLFTAGMAIVDSVDSVLMLYSYAGFTDQNKWALLKRRDPLSPSDPSALQLEHTEEMSGLDQEKANGEPEPTPSNPVGLLDSSLGNHLHPPTRAEVSQSPVEDSPESQAVDRPTTAGTPNAPVPDSVTLDRTTRVKLNTMTNLSIVMTVISILVAFSISLITIMGLIGAQCRPCIEAANAENGGGLAGRWWRGWAKANDDSGFIGAAIVGGFVGIVVGWYVIRRVRSRWTNRPSKTDF